MSLFYHLKWKFILGLFILPAFFVACSEIKQPQKEHSRLEAYFHSENEEVSALFCNEEINERIQPALTQTELKVLDILAETVGPEVTNEFDNKYLAWLNSWAGVDQYSLVNNPYYALKCNEAAYHDLIEFCRRQNENVLLLFYQLAARADCPYDQFLLRPTHDLFENFPEFGQYWEGVNMALQNEKPDLENRKCNETTIWYTRKILETKYGYTYASRLSSIFDTRKLLLMTQ
ncbi:MAG: hypothetical protein LBQ60_02085 [Bacteroidales bacterium]|jgi:hypothetical protein|nr:hypothetical protein [Bacteroidales bacterium]